MQKNILIVDDDVGIRGLMFRLFRENYQIRLAYSGGEALRCLGESRPDLVLLDRNMPGMDGLQTLKTMRQFYPEIKVIMISAESEPQAIKQCLDAGADAYFTKPLSMRELALGISEVMSPLCKEESI